MPKLRIVCLCGIFLTPLLAPTVFAESQTRLTNSTVPFSVNHAQVLGTADPDKTVEFQIALKMRNYADLQARLAQGQTIPLDQMASNYYPSASDHGDLIQWLENQGLTVAKTYRNYLTVEVKGSVADVSRALGVSFSQVLVEGKAYIATQTAPSLPLHLQRFVVGINGLQPYLQAVPLHGTVTPQSPTQAFVPPYSVNDILTAYSAKNLGVKGSNQKTAILIDTTPLTSDLEAFWSANGVTQSLNRIKTINVTGATLPPPTGEETLDVSWSSAIAPNSSVRIYATATLSFTDLDKGFQKIINDLPTQTTMKQLSISLGACEKLLSSSQIQTDEQFLATIASQGVSTFVSSGDSGSNGGSGVGNCKFTKSVDYYASSASVAATGGTALTLNSSGAVTSETAWSGSGGGISGVITRPSWQVGAGVPSGTTRLVPDISANADPNTGYYLVLNGQVVQIGGTSASAPVWAGFSALINQARVNSSKGSLGLLGPRVYPLIGTTSFRDITSGSNGAYSATANYDLVTGIGVPVVKNLLNALVAQP